MAILTIVGPENWRRHAREFRFAMLFFCVLMFSAFMLTPVRADDALPSEAQLKAASLVNLPKYVDWPVAVFATTNSPFVLAILGDTKVNDEVAKVIEGRNANGRQLLLKRLAFADDLSGFQILFIAASEQTHAAVVLAKLKNACVLTVGESDDFLNAGGMINLVRHDRKIGLEINMTAANASGIKISSRLLSVADAVRGKTK